MSNDRAALFIIQSSVSCTPEGRTPLGERLLEEHTATMLSGPLAHNLFIYLVRLSRNLNHLKITSYKIVGTVAYKTRRTLYNDMCRPNPH